MICKFEHKGYVNFTRSKVSDGYNFVAQQQRVNTIKDLVKENPRASIRKASRALNVPQTSSQRAFSKTLKLKPYKIKFLQQLKADYPRKTLLIQC